jgi:hypothetical protein
MIEFDVQLTDDDMYRICAIDDDQEVCSTVSSAHLIEPKKKYLIAAIERQRAKQ